MIKTIRNNAIRKALIKCGHQYLAGDLSRRQLLSYIPDEDVNVGIGYHAKYESEGAHFHSECTEYQYVIKGKAKYFDLDKKKEFLVKKGDFFLIEKETNYTLKAKKGCTIIFFKYPAVDDKIDYSGEDEIKIKKWQSGWRETWGSEKGTKTKPKHKNGVREKNGMVSFYKKNSNVSNREKRRAKDSKVITEIYKRSIITVAKVLAALFSVVGFCGCISELQQYINVWWLIGTLFIGVAVFFGCSLRDYYYYKRRVITERINEVDFRILEDDYIANMIRVLSMDEENEKCIIFALGMNETILANQYDENNERIKYKSIAEAFYCFMKEYFNIDITEVIQEKFSNKEYPKFGEVFPVEYVIKESVYPEMNELVGSRFCVLYYVNSYNEDNDPEKEIIEDPHDTVKHVIDAASNYINENLKGKSTEVTLMIPAIGTGKTGKGSCKHVLVDTINNLFLPKITLPDQIIISLRDYMLLGENFEAERLLVLAKKMYSK